MQSILFVAWVNLIILRAEPDFGFNSVSKKSRNLLTAYSPAAVSLSKNFVVSRNLPSSWKVFLCTSVIKKVLNLWLTFGLVSASIVIRGGVKNAWEVRRWPMNTKRHIITADYFGLKVEVICRMENCSLICFQGRESIVETADLVFIRRLYRAAWSDRTGY